MVEFKEANKTVGDAPMLQFISLPLHLVSEGSFTGFSSLKKEAWKLEHFPKTWDPPQAEISHGPIATGTRLY